MKHLHSHIKQTHIDATTGAVKSMDNNLFQVLGVKDYNVNINTRDNAFSKAYRSLSLQLRKDKINSDSHKCYTVDPSEKDDCTDTAESNLVKIIDAKDKFEECISKSLNYGVKNNYYADNAKCLEAVGEIHLEELDY